ncbi:hypothetical protein Tco_0792208 [Tanacetum coccineum]
MPAWNHDDEVPIVELNQHNDVPVIPLTLQPPASESEPDDEIEVENLIEHEDETVPVSVYEVGESSTVAIPREDGDRLLLGFMRRDIDSLFGQMLKARNVKEKAECKKLKKELEEAKLRVNTILQRPNEAINVPIEDVESSSPKES